MTNNSSQNIQPIVNLQVPENPANEGSPNANIALGNHSTSISESAPGASVVVANQSLLEIGATAPEQANQNPTGGAALDAAPTNGGIPGLVPAGTVCGKPRFLTNSNSVLNLKSGFDHKLLCDGLTFTAGQACAYSCTFCYVENLLKAMPNLRRLREERNLRWEEMVIDISDAATKVRHTLTRRGQPRFNNPDDRRVIFGSPLVDVAATMEQIRVTVQICTAILELTHWQIRLLSKSSLLRQVAERIPEQYKNRVIYGLSTGTLDSELAASFEIGTALVSKRLETLRWLQEHGYRTYAMICPILPQPDYAAFAAEVAEKMDIAACEHFWAEAINVRGESLTRTSQALRAAGYDRYAELLEHVSTNEDAWEEYARATYDAIASVVPREKLRFLQYVTKATRPWWQERADQGVVVL